MLHPESSGGTPRSVQDRSPEMLMRQVRSIGRYRDSRNAGGHQSSADDTLLESAGPTQCQSEARGNAPESDLLDAMEFDFTMGDSDPDDVPLEQCVEHPRRRLVLVGVLRMNRWRRLEILTARPRCGVVKMMLDPSSAESRNPPSERTSWTWMCELCSWCFVRHSDRSTRWMVASFLGAEPPSYI